MTPATAPPNIEAPARAGQARAGGGGRGTGVKELLRTNDAVELSWVGALLADAGIETLVLDSHASIVEGSIGAIQRRVMVADDDLADARRVLADADVR